MNRGSELKFGGAGDTLDAGIELNGPLNALLSCRDALDASQYRCDSAVVSVEGGNRNNLYSPQTLSSRLQCPAVRSPRGPEAMLAGIRPKQLVELVVQRSSGRIVDAGGVSEDTVKLMITFRGFRDRLRQTSTFLIHSQNTVLA